MPNKRSAIISILTAFFVFFVCGAFASKSFMGEGLRITSTFGGLRGDHFHTGIDLSNSEKKVYSLTDGQVIFHSIVRKNSINYGYGNFVIIEDPKKNIRVTYAHLKEDSYDSGKKIFKKGEVIADIGSSGHSTGPHLHLEIDDISGGALSNPLDFVFREDAVKPRIDDVYFMARDNKKISVLYGNNVISRGGKLFVKCSDRMNDGIYDLTPYRITLILDGKIKADVRFDRLMKDQDRFLTTDARSYKDIYFNNEDFDFYLTDFSALPGVVGLKLTVEDYNGNKTEFKRPIRVLMTETSDN